MTGENEITALVLLVYTNISLQDDNGSTHHLDTGKLTKVSKVSPDGSSKVLLSWLESLPKSDHFPSQRHRWNTNEVRYVLVKGFVLG